MGAIPSKYEAHFLRAFLETGLVDSKQVHLWLDRQVKELDNPPLWILDMATERSLDGLIKVLRSYINSEPFVPEPDDLDRFSLACLWLGYQRDQMSWMSFLRLAGEHLDSCNSSWACEVPYYYLTQMEKARFIRFAENSTRRQYLKQHDLKPWVDKVNAKLTSMNLETA